MQNRRDSLRTLTFYPDEARTVKEAYDNGRATATIRFGNSGVRECEHIEIANPNKQRLGLAHVDSITVSPVSHLEDHLSHVKYDHDPEEMLRDRYGYDLHPDSNATIITFTPIWWWNE